MRDDEIGRLFRMLRIRQEWSQATVARRADISRAAICRIEGGEARRYRLETIQRHGSALRLRVELRAVGRGGDLARLLDEEHAAIVEWLATVLVADGWLVDPEASYSIYGERGRIDLLAFHPETGTLLVVEVKTELDDLQALFGSLNVKERLAPQVARERGWTVRRVSTLLAVADTSSTRVLVRRHGTLFGGFERHSSRVRARLHRRIKAEHLLLYVPAEVATDGRRARWLAARRRVRKPGSGRSDR